MRVLVCGSRTWKDERPIYTLLAGLYWKGGAPDQPWWMTIIEGGASGADGIAARWAAANDHFVKHERYLADWDAYGKAAGAIRNKQMLEDGQPDIVLAFSEHPVTPGTANMIRQAKKAGVPVWVVGHG